jgi:ABC-type nitrate/sulfonate/bicarbonate transport system substrate-binding protein
MKKNTSLILSGLIVLIFVGILGYLAYQKAHPKMPTTFDTLKVAYQEDNLNNYLLMDIADSKEFFKQNGLIIERQTGLKNISTYVTSGQVDISQSALAASLSNFYSGQDLKALAVVEKYPASTRIVSRYPQDQLGKVKNAAVERVGGTLEYMTWVMSKNLGMNTSSLNYVVAATPQATVALLEKGSVDFALISDVDAYKQIQAKGGFYTIDPQKAFNGVSFPMGVVSSSKTISKKGGDIKKYIDSISEAYTYFTNHKTEMITFMSNKYSLSKTDSEADYNFILASHKGVNFTISTDLLKNVNDAVKALDKPTTSRTLQNFIDSNI